MEMRSIPPQSAQNAQAEKPPFRAELRCIECGSSHPIDQILYRCPLPTCGSLLEVRHDLKALKSVSGKEWQSILDSRRNSCSHPYCSGVWDKKEWILPQIADEHIATLGEGNSPLIALPRRAEELQLAALWVKQCGISHSGSFKDLGMTVLISHLISLRAAGAGIEAVACASTGDTSAALAAYAAYAGIPSIVFLPAGKISAAQLTQPMACGSIVLSLKTDFDGCMQVVQEVTRQNHIYLANSMNPLRIEGQKSIGIEIVAQLNWMPPDWIIIPGGNLGNVSALGAGLTLLKELGLIERLPRICVAQSAQANPLYRSFLQQFSRFQPIQAGATLASAIQIGDPVSREKAIRTLRRFQGVVEQASEEELANAAAESDREGMFHDPHTGVALAALQKLRKSSLISKGERVVVISTAHGLKFAASKEAYHQGQLELEAPYRNPPVEVEADTSSVLKLLEKKLGRTQD